MSNLTSAEKLQIFKVVSRDYHVDEGDSVQHATFPSEGIYKVDHGQWLVGTLSTPIEGTEVPTQYRVQSLEEAIAIYGAYLNGPTGDN